MRWLIVLVMLSATAVAHAEHWRLVTDRGPVHVWTPANYDRATASTVVFVHGYNTDVDNAWTEYKLQDQFEASGLNAMFIVPSAPASKNNPVYWGSLTNLLKTVHVELDQPLPDGELIAVGHSGAYRTLVLWLTNPALHTLVLLDAAYGEEDQFMAWTRDNQHHRLINVASDTIQESNWIAAYLPATKRVDGLAEWTDETRSARVLYVRTNVGHMPMITDGIALPLALRALK